ncbi:MAG TPA: glycine zipper 2TM domain-containing protein [Burkholderiales bacterium]|nr:glycine zipper 2TM domain-containing protein [Burkholderiales bacterium]
MIHRLVAVASVAVIVASGVGVAAMTGYLPGASAEKASAGATAPVQVAPPSKPKCRNCGVIREIKEVTVKGEGTGLGAVAGGVAGAVIGHEIGEGRNKKLVTVAGAAGGAIAGHEIEKHARTSKRYDITVRTEDGIVRTVSLDSASAWQVGDRVRVVNGRIEKL